MPIDTCMLYQYFPIIIGAIGYRLLAKQLSIEDVNRYPLPAPIDCEKKVHIDTYREQQ